MRLPKIVHSSQLTVHSVDKTVNSQPSTINRKAKGFTLIELLVVITIIAIMIGAGAYSWSNAQLKGRDGKRKSDLKAIQQALESYYQDIGHYPPWTTGNENVGWCGIIYNSAVQSALVPTYISQLPSDPVYPTQAKGYLYKKVAAGKYELVSILENNNDPDRGNYTDYASCTQGYSPYNYKVANP